MSASERPATRIVPAVGSISLISRRMSVDLPLPVEPTRNTNSPRRAVNETASTPASPLGYVFVTRENSITTGRGGACSGGIPSRARISASVVAIGCKLAGADGLPCRFGPPATAIATGAIVIRNAADHLLHRPQRPADPPR